MKILDIRNELPRHKGGRKWGKRDPQLVNEIITHQALQDASVRAINKYHITPANMNMTPDQIKGFREVLKLTPGAFARKLGIDAGLVRNWESGIESPSGKARVCLGRLQNHISIKGCPHICYHYYIPGEFSGYADDEILLVNDLTDWVWHAGSANKTSIGVLVEGDLKGPGHPGGHDPLDTQLERVDWLLRFLNQHKNYIASGHCDHGKPACPGDAVMLVVNKFK